MRSTSMTADRCIAKALAWSPLIVYMLANSIHRRWYYQSSHVKSEHATLGQKNQPQRTQRPQREVGVRFLPLCSLCPLWLMFLYGRICYRGHRDHRGKSVFAFSLCALCVLRWLMFL